MSKGQVLRSLVKQRLTAAAEEIFVLFEKTIVEYEEELCRSKEENERQQQLLDAVFKPQLRLHRADVHPLNKEGVPRKKQQQQQQKKSPSLDQEDPEAPHIKEEQDELWTNQKREQLEAFTFTPVAVKSEDDEEKPQTSRLHQRQTEQHGGPKRTWNSAPGAHLLPDDRMENYSEPETDDSDDWRGVGKPQLRLNPLQNNGVPGGDARTSGLAASSQFHQRRTEQIEIEDDPEYGVGPQTDPDGLLRSDERIEEHFEPETQSGNDDGDTGAAHLGLNLLRNNGSNARDNSFHCLECGSPFHKNAKLKTHSKAHGGEKSCSLCTKRFAQIADLDYQTYSGEKPFSCSVCAKRFSQRTYLQRHLKCHSGEKPFTCSLCNKNFTRFDHLQSHMRIHTGEKPYSCRVCDKRFTWSYQVKRHKCAGESAQFHELWANQEADELQALQDADITKFIFTPVPVKSEDDEDGEAPQSSQVYHGEQMEMEADGGDCGEPEAASNSDPESLESRGLTWTSFTAPFW